MNANCFSTPHVLEVASSTNTKTIQQQLHTLAQVQKNVCDNITPDDSKLYKTLITCTMPISERLLCCLVTN